MRFHPDSLHIYSIHRASSFLRQSSSTVVSSLGRRAVISSAVRNWVTEVGSKLGREGYGGLMMGKRIECESRCVSEGGVVC
jgi:hypothetical protein